MHLSAVLEGQYDIHKPRLNMPYIIRITADVASDTYSIINVKECTEIQIRYSPVTSTLRSRCDISPPYIVIAKPYDPREVFRIYNTKGKLLKIGLDTYNASKLEDLPSSVIMICDLCSLVVILHNNCFYAFESSEQILDIQYGICLFYRFDSRSFFVRLPNGTITKIVEYISHLTELSITSPITVKILNNTGKTIINVYDLSITTVEHEHDLKVIHYNTCTYVYSSYPTQMHHKLISNTNFDIDILTVI